MPQTTLSKLPAHIKERLLERPAGEEVVTIPASPAYGRIVMGGLSAAWLVLLFLLSDLFRWERPFLFLFGLLTVLAIFFVIRGIYELLLPSSSRNSLLATRHYVVDLQDDSLEYQNIDNLVTVKSSHKYEGGKYKRTQIDLILEGGIRTGYIYDMDAAEDAVEKIELFRKCFLEAAAKGDADYFESTDDFRDLPEPEGRNVTRPLQFPIKTALASLILGAGIMLGAIWTNNYFDDVNTWAEVHEADRASGYRTYLKAHPRGRWSASAAERLQSLYDSAEAKYRSSLNEDYDPEAADALAAILRYAKETGNYQVEVVFERRLDVSESLVEEVRSEFDVAKVLPLDDSFSEEKMLRRETNLLKVVGTALSQVFPEDILEIGPNCPGECAKFRIAYETTFKNSIYYDNKEENLPRAERTFYPGILITWNFGVSLPSQERTYEFELESIPAKTIDYEAVDETAASFAAAQGNFEKLEKYNFYDGMVNSAFDDFRQHLVYELGIGPPPRDSVETETEDNNSTAGAEPLRLSKPSVPQTPRSQNSYE